MAHRIVSTQVKSIFEFRLHYLQYVGNSVAIVVLVVSYSPWSIAFFAVCRL